MPTLWQQVILGVLLIAYVVLWYFVESRLRTITRRHVEKIGEGSSAALYRIYRLQVASVRVIFVLWIFAGVVLVLALL